MTHTYVKNEEWSGGRRRLHPSHSGANNPLKKSTVFEQSFLVKFIYHVRIHRKAYGKGRELASVACCAWMEKNTHSNYGICPPLVPCWQRSAVVYSLHFTLPRCCVDAFCGNVYIQVALRGHLATSIMVSWTKENSITLRILGVILQNSHDLASTTRARDAHRSLARRRRHASSLRAGNEKLARTLGEVVGRHAHQRRVAVRV